MGSKLGYYLFVRPLSMLPLSVLYVFSDLFYLLTISVFPYRKKVISENLKRSFPKLSEKKIKAIRRQFYRHFADILVEGIANLHLSKKQLEKRVRVLNPEVMDALFNEGKSVVLVGGHFNNWEWVISSQNFLFKHQAFGIGMPMSNKFWDAKVNAKRQRFGMNVIHAGNFKEALAEEKGSPIAVLTLSDQAPGDARKSYWMEFLNQQTPVLFGTEMMAHDYNFAVVFFSLKKIKRGSYTMELKLITENPKEMKWGEITEAHVHLLEKEINENPPYWLWSHKRWKREIPKNLIELKKEQHAKFNSRFGY
ncbi:MAG: lysophospholipid acyltransferase family protein [Bacteroidota bacterium]